MKIDLLRRSMAVAFLGFSTVFGGQVALAGDDVLMLPVENAMATPDAQAKLDGSVKFYFGDTPHGKVVQSLGEAVTNKKTNAFGKSDAVACNRALLSGLIALQERARSLGGNAVVNVQSYYNKQAVSNATHFECHSGFLMAGVALKGDVVKLNP